MMKDADGNDARTPGPGLFGGFFANMFVGVEESSPDKARVVGAVRASFFGCVFSLLLCISS